MKTRPPRNSRALNFIAKRSCPLVRKSAFSSDLSIRAAMSFSTIFTRRPVATWWLNNEDKMLETAIIVFREVLEASLVVGIVRAGSRGVAGRGFWVTSGIAAGILGAMLVAAGAEAIA